MHHAIEGGEPSRAERIAEAETLKVDIVNKERKRLGDNNQAQWKEAALVSQLEKLAKLLPP